MGEAIGQVSDPQPCDGSGGKRDAVVGFESPLRANRNNLAAIHKLPGLSALHQGLMGGQFLRPLR